MTLTSDDLNFMRLEDVPLCNTSVDHIGTHKTDDIIALAHCSFSQSGNKRIREMKSKSPSW